MEEKEGLMRSSPEDFSKLCDNVILYFIVEVDVIFMEISVRNHRITESQGLKKCGGTERQEGECSYLLKL